MHFGRYVAETWIVSVVECFFRRRRRLTLVGFSAPVLAEKWKKRRRRE
jgi:hypothetical protein